MDVNWLPQHGRGPDNQVGLDTNKLKSMKLFVLMIKVASFNVV